MDRCAATLPQGNVHDVEDETLELIERLGPDEDVAWATPSPQDWVLELERKVS